MVKSISPSEIQEVISIIMPIIESQGACSVNYGVRTYFKCNPDEMEDHVIDKVTATVVRDGKYIFFVRDQMKHRHDYNIFRNPNYELNENIKSTNLSLQSANASTKELNVKTNQYYNQLKWATWVIALATGINVIVAAIPLFKNNDELLQIVHQSIENENKEIEEMAKYQKDNNGSAKKTTDGSLLKNEGNLHLSNH